MPALLNSNMIVCFPKRKLNWPIRKSDAMFHLADGRPCHELFPDVHQCK